MPWKDVQRFPALDAVRLKERHDAASGAFAKELRWLGDAEILGQWQQSHRRWCEHQERERRLRFDAAAGRYLLTRRRGLRGILLLGLGTLGLALRPQGLLPLLGLLLLELPILPGLLLGLLLLRALLLPGSLILLALLPVLLPLLLLGLLALLSALLRLSSLLLSLLLLLLLWLLLALLLPRLLLVLALLILDRAGEPARPQQSERAHRRRQGDAFDS